MIRLGALINNSRIPGPPIYKDAGRDSGILARKMDSGPEFYFPDQEMPSAPRNSKFRSETPFPSPIFIFRTARCLIHKNQARLKVMQTFRKNFSEESA